MVTLSTINKDNVTSYDATVVKLLLHSDESLDSVTKTFILNASVEFISLSNMFDGRLTLNQFCVTL